MKEKVTELYQMGEEQRLNQQREFLYSKRLACSPQTFQFTSNIYDKILKKIKAIHSSSVSESSLEKRIQKELKERLLSHSLFAHKDTNHYQYHDLHGSVAEGSVYFFETLSERSNAYFDIMFTAISNAIFQYKQEGLINLFQMSREVPIEIEEIRKYRIKSTISAPLATEMPLLPEERAHYDNDDVYASRGEHQFQLNNCAYTDRASRLCVPIITGMSGDTYLVFKFLTLFLKLNKQEFIELRKALIAYLVASHDHSLIEVIDAINLVLNDSNFAEQFNFNTQELSTAIDRPIDYQQVVESIFAEVINEDELTIQKNCKFFLEQEVTPKWAYKLIYAYVLKLDVDDAEKSRIVNQTLDEIFLILRAIIETDAYILREYLNEDQDVCSITNIEAIIDLYCASKYSDLPLKLLGEGSIVRGLIYPTTTEQHAKASYYLMRNFGLSFTKIGMLLNFTSLAERAKLSNIPFGIEHLESGTGAILSSKEYTPLLNIIWIIAAAINGQEVFIVRDNEGFHSGQILSEEALYDAEHHKPTMLCFEVMTLAAFGYEATNIEDHGLTFNLQQNSPVDLKTLFQSLDVLTQMDKETLVLHVNGSFPTTHILHSL